LKWQSAFGSDMLRLCLQQPPHGLLLLLYAMNPCMHEIMHEYHITWFCFVFTT